MIEMEKKKTLHFISQEFCYCYFKNCEAFRKPSIPSLPVYMETGSKARTPMQQTCLAQPQRACLVGGHLIIEWPSEEAHQPPSLSLARPHLIVPQV